MADATVNANQTEPAAAPSFLLRAGLVFTAWTTVHLLVVAALANGLVPGGWWTFGAVYALLLVAIYLILRGIVSGAYPGKTTRLLVQRPFWYAQIAIFPMSIAGAIGFLAGLPFGSGAAFGRGALLVVGGLIGTLAVAGYFGSRYLVVRRMEFAFPDLPAAFDGMTIAQLSDLHVGPHTPAGFLARIVRVVEEAKPDLVAFTGDQVDDHDVDVGRFGEVFGHLRAPLGVYAIAGNHDVYAGWDGVRAGMEKVGMRVLVNDAEPVKRGADELWIVGTGDPAGMQNFGGARPDVAPDVQRSLAKVPAGAFTLALAHNPALWPALAQRGVHMTLSGHTHHGQISIPALKWSLASPFLEHARGSYERERSKLYINPGTNYWGIPLRLGAWPEVTVVTLRRKALP